MKIVTRTLSDQAFEVIRERILSTQIQPLAPIRQDALAEELGISKIPLREALGRLEQHGLLSSHPNRGYFVPALTPTEAEEVFALRLKIEPEAAAAASLAADEAQREAAKVALVSLEAASNTDAPGPSRSTAPSTWRLFGQADGRSPRNWSNGCTFWPNATCASTSSPKAAMSGQIVNIARS